MPHALDWPLLILTSHLESGHYASEALFFPEIERLAGKPPLPPLLASLRQHLPTFPRLELHRRLPPETWEIQEYEVRVPPPKASPGWREPVLLKVLGVRYQDALYIPLLGLEVANPDPESVASQVRACLARNQQNLSLGGLLSVAEVRKLSVKPELLALSLPNLKESESATPAEESLLARLATPLGKTRQRARGYEHWLERMVEILTALEGCRSLLLVGPHGVGKTALVHELARQRSRYRLGATAFHETSGARLIAGACGFGGWQERCQQLVEEWGKSQALLHLGNLAELFEVGRHRTQPYGMAGFLRGPLLRGQVQASAECTPEQQTYLEKEFPQLLEAFTILRVTPPSRAQTRVILNSPQADEVQDLRERFAPHASSPGWEFTWLERSRGANLLETFASQTGLPLVYLDPDRPLDPEQLTGWFNQRLHGQPLAVERLVERLTAFKSALNRPGRPLASLLLLGPTGVGKTELARLLAEHLYGQRTRLTRFDMSEYSDPLSVQRLVGIPGVAASGQLILKVRESPFQVLLFDELEKAHPDFFDLLLQLLDDGRLTDAAGNLADFSSCLVLMTTNLGADSLQKGQPGLRQRPGEGGFLEAVRSAFRPELLNRIDEVLPFAPLSREVIRALAERELEEARRRPGLTSRNLTWTVEPGTLDWLAEAGYDARYGARVLQRTLERLVLVPLAEQLNLHSEEVPLEVQVGREVRVRALSTADQAREESRRRLALGREASGLRQRLSRFTRGPLVVGLQNQRTRARRAKQPFPQQKWLDGLEDLKVRVLEWEEQALLALDRQLELDELPLRAALASGHAELRERLLYLFARQFEPADRLTLALYSDSPHPLMWAGRGYLRLADELRFEYQLQTLAVRSGVPDLPTDDEPFPQLQRTQHGDPQRLWKGPPAHLVGILIRLVGSGCAARLHQEAGLHRFERGDSHWRLRVYTSSDELPACQPPAPVHRKHALEALLTGNPTRLYDLERGRVQVDEQKLETGRDNELNLEPLTSFLLQRAAEAAGLAR